MGEEIEGLHKGGSLRGHAVAQNGGVVKVHLGEVVGVGFLPGTFGHGEKEGTDHQGLVLQMGQLLVNGVGALGQGLAVGPFQPGGEPAVLRSLKGDPALGGVRGVAVENFAASRTRPARWVSLFSSIEKYLLCKIENAWGRTAVYRR